MVVLVAGCATPSEEVTSASTTTAPPAGEGWEQLPAAPLTPRSRAVLVTLEDGRLLVVGGDTAPGCHDTLSIPQDPPQDRERSGASAGPAVISAATADCAGPEKETRLRDGAIIDAAGKWTEIPEAPAPLSAPARGVVVGDIVYFWAVPTYIQGESQPGAWISYDPQNNSWRRLSDPELGEHPNIEIVRAGDRLIAYQTTDESGEKLDRVYDPAADTWSDLPDDPLPASFDRMMVWTGPGVVLLGRDSASLGNPSGPTLRGAVFELRSGTWRLLAETEVSHSNVTWEWALPRLVNASALGTDPALGSALPPAPSLPPNCDEVRRPSTAEPEDGESNIGDLRLGQWTGRVPPETDWTTTCNPELPDFAVSSAWAFDGVVTFGGYDTVAEPGQFPTDYRFRNDTWVWRPA